MTDASPHGARAYDEMMDASRGIRSHYQGFDT